ncbi:SRPBCC family protein (plasmid) [Rhodococcus qingshengii]|uniref:SRPBCC family protein n=1 Tax=Rhodococcus qingshengii TaxID=334542 RepID=UPI001E59DEC6|nr:SRPBCC family protein [Rhodococcus qingshengii]UGQ55426.1 SRPBCC family protein [Rhodococcus qingshengii]
MQSIRKSLWINSSPDKVWSAIADVGAVASWFPSIAASRLDGTIRTCTLERGGTVVEEIVRVDHSLCRLQYRVKSGMPATAHLATVDVIDGEDGRSLVVYSTDVEPDRLGALIGSSIEAALVNLERLVAESK